MKFKIELANDSNETRLSYLLTAIQIAGNRERHDRLAGHISWFGHRQEMEIKDPWFASDDNNKRDLARVAVILERRVGVEIKIIESAAGNRVTDFKIVDEKKYQPVRTERARDVQDISPAALSGESITLQRLHEIGDEKEPKGKKPGMGK